MAGKQRTIKVDDDLWIQLQNIAAIQNTTCTALINEDIRARVARSITPDLKAKLNKEIEKNLSSEMRDSLVQQITNRVMEKLREEKGLSMMLEQVKTVELFKDKKQDIFYPTEDKDSNFPEGKTDIVETVETFQTVGTVGNEKAVNQKKKKTVETVEVVRDREVSRQEKRQNNLAKFKHYKASVNRIGKSDVGVAIIEGVSREAVRRYRKGDRLPKQEFIEKWGLNWDESKWIEIKEGD